MKYFQNTFIVILAFIVMSSALVIDKRSADIITEDQFYLPSRAYNTFLEKRDVNELHNTGGSKTTTVTTTSTNTATRTSTATRTATATIIPSTNPADVYGGISITPQNGVVGAALIVLGLYLMVFGFRSFRLTLGVCGFLTFALITWVAMANNQPFYGYINNDITIIAVPAGLGILGAIIYSFFWVISIYLVGALGGLALALYIMCCKENLLITQVVGRAALMVALPFFMSFITFFAERYVLLFTFAFVGSYCFIVGIDFLAHTGYLAGIKSILDGNQYHRVSYSITRNVIILIVFIAIVFVISFGWQFMYNKGQKFGVIFVEEKKEAGGKEEKGEAGDPGEVNKDEPHIKEEKD